MTIKNLPLKTKLMMLAGLFVLGMVTFGALAFSTLNQVKIGGDAFTAISNARDIDGDYSPPTGYIVGARVLIFQMEIDGARDRAQLDAFHHAFEQERQTFEDAHEKYSKTVAPEMRELLEKSYQAGHRYFEIAETKFIPLMYAGKVAEADAVRPELKATFIEHKAANDTFEEANMAYFAQLEKGAIATSRSRTISLVIVALAALILVLAMCAVIANGILTPIRATVEVLHQVSRGNLSERLETAGSDEVAQMGVALNETVENLSRIISGIESDANALTAQSETIAETSTLLGTNSEQTTSQADSVSSAAEQVSQNLQTVATATEEMSASIKEISKNASEAAEVASSAARLAGSTTATMSKLSESSAEIGQVVKVITSIAGQTNLLALNATIEAARAGEAGKGFAVVANEVKELAKQTAKATEEIGAKVQAIQSDAQGAVEAIGEITTVIGRINDIQNTIASAVEEQTGTTNEISRNITESVSGSSEIASNISGVAKAAAETKDTAANSQRAAAELSALANKLNGVVSGFKLARLDQHANGLARVH